MIPDRTQAPREFQAHELAPATCMACRKVGWWIEGGKAAGGGDLLLDLAHVAGETLASIHPCGVDLEPEDLDDPDWGWMAAG